MTVLDHDVVADQLKNAPTENKSVLSFVSRIAALTTPEEIVWVDGSEAQKNQIADQLVERGAALSLGGSVYDPHDPVGRLLFNVLGMVAEFEADLIRMRTREGMAIAKARGRLKGRAPSLSPSRRRHLLTLVDAGDHTHTELAELFQISRATVYREIQRRATTPTTNGESQ